MKTYICAKCSSRVCVSSCEEAENDRPKFCPVYGRPNQDDWHVAGKEANSTADTEGADHE